MANFDSGILTGLAGDWGTLESVLETKLPTKVSLASSGTGSGSTTSASYSSLANVSVSVSTDDIVLVIGLVNGSISDGAGSKGAVRLYRDSTNLTNDYFIADNSSDSGGQRCSVTLGWYDENQSGTINYAIKIARFSGSGTVHYANSQLFVLQWKKRS